MRLQRSRRGALAGVALAACAAAAPPAATAGVLVDGATLRVSLGNRASTASSGNAAQVSPLSGGGVIVSFHGSMNSSDQTAGAGCQQTATSNAPALGTPFPGSGGASFAATCTLDGVRVIEGRLMSTNGNQGWLSLPNLPTTVISTANSTGTAGQGGDRIFTGEGGDRITGATENDVIDAGRAPFKGQEALPPTGTASLDDPGRNIVNGGGGNDTFELARGTGRDAITGGAGVDTATYANRFTVGAPGAVGVNVTLDGTANDGDPNIDPPDSTNNGEVDNIGTDVENLIGTKRDDRLIGNGLNNTLTGDEGVDTLTGSSGEDTLLAREPATAGTGTRDVLSCGPPLPGSTTTTSFGVFSISGGIDKLEADLADVKPADCEQLIEMAVDEPAPVNIAGSARLVSGNRLAARLTCPRAARRSCRGTLRMGGTRSGSRTARFSLGRGARRTVNLSVSRRVAAALADGSVRARLLSNENGLRGEIDRISLVRVR